MKKLTLFPAVVLLFISSPVEAQEDCHVLVTWDCSPTVEYSHHAGEHWEGGDGGSVHGSCLYCLENHPEDCHECEPTFAHLTDAMNERNLATLLVLAESSPDYLTVNRARAALQLRSCDRETVIGSIHLTTEQLTEFVAVIDEAVSAAIAAALEQRNPASQMARPLSTL